MTPLPIRIKGRARPSEHPPVIDEGNNRDNDCPERLASHVRNGIQRYLSGIVRRFISAPFCNKRMRSLMASKREKKCYIPNEAIRRIVFHVERFQSFAKRFGPGMNDYELIRAAGIC